MSLIDKEDNLVEVRRGNVFLKITKSEIERYIAKGFDLVDANGNVLKASVPTNIGTLQKAYTDHLEEIKKLKAEIESLKAQISAPAKSAPAKKTSTKKSE